jgi:shikimate kinase
VSRIYLTGFMGSGKSTLGKRLSAALGYAFLDLDAQIERRAGRSIPEIFSEEGEPRFRELEREALQGTYGMQRVVVAVGGGALGTVTQLEAALRNGLVVYLDAKVDTLKKRLSGTEATRPLLNADSDMEKLLGVRKPVYRMADITLNVDDINVEQAAEALRIAVQAHGKGRESI